MRLVNIACLFLPYLAAAQTAEQVQLHGTVTDARSGKVVHTTVEWRDPAGALMALAPVNADGHYALFVPADAGGTLCVLAENGYADLHVPLPDLGLDARTFGIDLVLQPR